MDLTFNGADSTSAANPDQIWVNDNYDRWHDVDCTLGLGCDTEQDDLGPDQISDLPAYQQVPDCDYTNSDGQPAIPCNRDLEDYFRLWMPGLASAMKAMPTGYSVQLTLTGTGGIRIFQAIEPNGGTNYLFDETTASNCKTPFLAIFSYDVQSLIWPMIAMLISDFSLNSHRLVLILKMAYSIEKQYRKTIALFKRFCAVFLICDC